MLRRFFGRLLRREDATQEIIDRMRANAAVYEVNKMKGVE